MEFKYDYNWTLFTTNYDRCLELFWDNALVDTKHKLDSGFSERFLDSDWFLHHIGSKFNYLQPRGWLRLIKLHGSTSWLVRRDNGKIEDKEYTFDQARNIGTGSIYTDEMVIYPLLEKQLYLEPYIQMFYCLDKELAYRNVWLVIGYSFRDRVIKNIFAINLTKNPSKKMVVVGPTAQEDIKRKFGNHNDKITSINACFGESNYEDVNRSIAQELKSL